MEISTKSNESAQAKTGGLAMIGLKYNMGWRGPREKGREGGGCSSGHDLSMHSLFISQDICMNEVKRGVDILLSVPFSSSLGKRSRISRSTI